MTNEIFKLQRALFSNDGGPPILVYNEDRSIIDRVSFTDELEVLFGDEPKIYVKAHMENKILVIDELVEDEPW